MTQHVREHIPRLVRELRSRYLSEGRAPSYCEINNGLCDDFAEDLKALVDQLMQDDTIFTVEGANFMVDDCWDAALLENHWQTTPPAGFTWSQLDAIPFGIHVWLTDGVKHYDAECPEGAESLFDLPLFRRYLVSDGRRRGLQLKDVVTDDVVPPPVCDVPMPL